MSLGCERLVDIVHWSFRVCIQGYHDVQFWQAIDSGAQGLVEDITDIRCEV